MDEPDTCEFCGQDCGPTRTVQIAGYDWPVRACPNLPDGWMAMGPDAVDGSLVITDLNAEEHTDG